MKKQGFTLIELLVVVAIIAVLSIIIIPSVINVNKNINKRMLSEKEEHIETAATLYASKNDDIFNGVDEVYVYVYDLINFGYLTVDVDTADSRCSNNQNTTKGCLIDPTNNLSLNNYYVILKKQGVGYLAEFVYDSEINGQDQLAELTLVETVCEAFKANKLTGQIGGKKCYCYDNANNIVGQGAKTLKNEDGQVVNSCIIAGESPNNYLRYGDPSKPNWRVLGIYNIGGSDGLVAKMITSEPI